MNYFLRGCNNLPSRAMGCRFLFIASVIFTLLISTGCANRSSDWVHYSKYKLNKQLQTLQSLDVSADTVERVTRWVLPKGYDFLMEQALEQAECESLRLGAYLSCTRRYQHPYSRYMLERDQVMRDAAELRDILRKNRQRMGLPTLGY